MESSYGTTADYTTAYTAASKFYILIKRNAAWGSGGSGSFTWQGGA